MVVTEIKTGHAPPCGCSECRAFFHEPIAARCTACEKPLLATLGMVADAQGRCSSCSATNAVAVGCECGYLAAGERCKCDDCRICERPIGNYEPTAKDAKVVPYDRECEECHAELVRAELRQRRLDDSEAA